MRACVSTEEAERLHKQFNDLCTPESHADCSKSGGKHEQHSTATRRPEAHARDAPEGRTCPRHDYGKYLLSCARQYGGGGAATDSEKEGAASDDEEEREEVEELVRAMLQTDWELGCTWFH